MQEIQVFLDPDLKPEQIIIGALNSDIGLIINPIDLIKTYYRPEKLIRLYYSDTNLKIIDPNNKRVTVRYSDGQMKNFSFVEVISCIHYRLLHSLGVNGYNDLIKLLAQITPEQKIEYYNGISAQKYVQKSDITILLFYSSAKISQ